MTKMHTQETENRIIPCPFHPSLIRPILVGGADRSLVLINVTAIVMLIFGVGIHLITLLLSGFLAVVGHSLLVWLAKYDSDLSRIYFRHIRYPAFYPAQSAALSKGIRQ
jgi:type IV secretory pathway TrbD component